MLGARDRLWRSLGLLLAGAAVLLAGWLFVRFGSGNAARLASPDMRWHVDFDSFWRSAVALRRGGDLYRTGAPLPNLDPPLLSVLLAPLASLDALRAYRVFALLTAVLIVGSVVAVAGALGLPARPGMLAVAALLASSPLQGTLALGQVYGLLTAALTAAWLAERRGHPRWSGVAIGLAVALKPSLLPLLAVPALGRRPETLRAAVLAGAAGTGIGVLAAGWSATWEWLGLLLAKRPDGFLDNDSLAALALRFGLPEWAGYLAAAALLGVTLARVRRRPEYALWAVTAAALLLAPIAWNNYLVLLAPAVPLLLARGRAPAALAVLALPLVGIEWSQLLSGSSLLARLGASLYCGMLLTHWAVLVGGPATVAECPSSPPDVRTPRPVPSH